METVTGQELRRAIDAGHELAIIDVRAPLARTKGHISVSSGIPLHELEQRIDSLVPHRGTPVVLASEPELDERAAAILQRLGYTDVSVLAGGLDGWTAAGGRLYTGTNVRSKTLGEWIEGEFGTKTVDSATVAAWRAAGEDVVVLDSRPHSEYVHHHIPGGYDTGGGAELAFRGLQAVTGPDTKIVVNCAGRTRGIVGAQSLVNTGIANPVYSLHNGTPAWGWAGLDLEHGTGHPLGAPAAVDDDLAKWAATVLDHEGADVIGADAVRQLRADTEHTVYVIDIRRPDEWAEGTVPGARQIQGGQLVQGTDEHLAVRRSHVVLVDTEDLVRAASTVQWLRYLHDGPVSVYVYRAGEDTGPTVAPEPLPDVPVVTGPELADELATSQPPLVLDLRSADAYAQGHLPGSVHARREQLPGIVAGRRVVLVGDDVDGPRSVGQDLHAAGTGSYQPHYAAQDLLDQGVDVRVVEGGPSTVPVALTDADPQYAGEVVDRVGPPPFGPERDAWYREYFEWEYALVPTSAGDPDFDFERKKP